MAKIDHRLKRKVVLKSLEPFQANKEVGKNIFSI